ncbi:uncharacterized protein LOC135222088 isoform X2 [Macrobrachium nipponense]|uniref:uncharacterized protein LOC135222088 isoform X2 n=1 Tax=Macrobrachium nipponense TaxID=159736 RepID=UPI0030C88002
MYNVSRGTPSRIINRTRRDINQKLETFDQIRELTRKSSNNVDSEEGDHHHHHHQQAQDHHHHHHQEATMTIVKETKYLPTIMRNERHQPIPNSSKKKWKRRENYDNQPHRLHYDWNNLPIHSVESKSSPRPVFQTVNNKGCRSTNGKGPSPETISPQHEELIKFFNESWGRVVKEVEMSRQSGHDSRGGGIAYYQEKHVHPALQDFKPFDLDAWWGKRLYQKLTQS